LLRSYLERYPDGEFAVLAKARLQSLEGPAETPQPQATTPNPADESFRQAQAADTAGSVAEAVQLYRAASDQGHARATALLGYAYEYGRGVTQNDDTAFELFSRAAAMGDVQGKFSLAWAFNNGKGTAADPRKSAELFLEALRSGENSAFYVKVLSDFRDRLQRSTIRAMQEELKASGLYPGAVDGSLGPTTVHAIEQMHHALPQSRAASPPDTNASVIINGSFESIDLETWPGGFWTPNGGSTAIPGWTVTGVSVDYVVAPYWQASDGIASLDLNGTTLVGGSYLGGVSQTFATIAGLQYVVRFDLAGNPNAGVQNLVVTAPGATQNYSFNTAGKTVAAMGYTAQQFTFTATGAASTLSFSSADGLGDFQGPVIDNVVVTPSSVSLSP
jgi:choice-of-anchor C domain-containing protein